MEQVRDERDAPKSGRRKFLLGAAGAAAALAAKGLVSTPDAEATNGDVVHVGQTTTGTVQTKIANSSSTGGNAFVGQGADPNASGVVGSNTGGGIGVSGNGSGAVPAIQGTNDSTGPAVRGMNTGFGNGVEGSAMAPPQYGVKGVHVGVNGQAVYGVGLGSNSWGVVGRSNAPGGTGVGGFSDAQGGYGVSGTGGAGGGVGVAGYALVDGCTAVTARDSSPGGSTAFSAVSQKGTAIVANGPVALDVTGVMKFSRSGSAVVQKGAKSTTVPGVSLTGRSLVLAVAQSNAKRYVVAAVPDVPHSRFTVFLNKAATSDLPVAWFVVN